MAQKVGDAAAIGPLPKSLSEEEQMADFIGRQIVPTTTRFMDLIENSKTAKV